MKELRRNMRLVGALIICLFTLLCAGYALTVYTQGAQWASTAYNTRGNASGSLRGEITDRNGVTLAATDQDGSRVYPEDSATRRALSQVVGDTRGMSGASVETFHSATLMNLSNSLTGRLSELISGARHVGNSMELTVDSRLQAYVSSIFPEGKKGAVCIVNYKTGEILCMVSKPDYDPAEVLAHPDTAVEDTAYLNRCLQGLYTPGSVFKIITAASALENDPGVVDQTFSCAGIWEFGSSKVNCAGNTAHGNLKLEKAFAKSCNVTFGKIAYQLGEDRLRATAERFGFNENFKFGDFLIYNSKFPTQTTGDADLVWAGVGQSTVLVTPLHMAMISASIANEGVMMRPKLVREITNSNGATVTRMETAAYRQVVSPQVAQTLASYMYEAVQSGTASKAAISGAIVCGKTGSAETSDDKSVKTNAWYTGFVYDDDHPYAIAVVIEEAGAGGSQAAPVAAKALKKALELAP